MCGICGIYNYARQGLEISEDILAGMRDTLRHRGPDADGLWISPDRSVGLAHTRLSIIDLSAAGNEPMSNEDGTVWLTFNGEIYNHLELRAGLEAAGHRYRSRTDAETVIHAYEEWGLDCVGKFHGMFAFAVWDGRSRALHLVRDRLGIKPLYFHPGNGSVIFASECKGILAHPAVSARPDWQALGHYLTFGAVPAPFSGFQGIRKLHPAQIVTVSASGDVGAKFFWNLFSGAAREREELERYRGEERERYCWDRVRQLLGEAVAERKMADVPIGTFLSGGVDSSAVTSLLAANTRGAVNTFSVAARTARRGNELKYAALIAEKYRTRQRELLIGEESWMEQFSSLSYYQDDPISDPASIPQFFLARLARENGVPVIQLGEGGDENFFGYPYCIHLVNRHREFWGRYYRSPRFVRQLLAQGFKLKTKDPERREVLRRAADSEEYFWGPTIAFTELEKDRLLAPGPAGRVSSHGVISEIFSRYDRTGAWDDQPSRMTYLLLKLNLPELLLSRSDRMCMASGIEARVPFLDHRLVEFAYAVPYDYKVSGGQGKMILKDSVRDLLPGEILDRPKVGFAAGAKEILTPGLVDYSRDIFRKQKGLSEFLRADYVENLYSRLARGESNVSSKIWTILCLADWYRRWISGERS